MTLLFLHHDLDYLTLLFVIDPFGVFLFKLNTLLYLLFFLLESPDVLDGGLLPLPRLNVESRPQGDEQNVKVIDGGVDVSQVGQCETFIILLVLEGNNDMHNE